MSEKMNEEFLQSVADVLERARKIVRFPRGFNPHTGEGAWKKRGVYIAVKRSVFIQSIYFILLSSFIVVFLFALSEVFTIRHFNERIEKIYKNSINYSGNYWADQFYVANKELKSLIDKNKDTDYNLICGSQDLESVRDYCWNLQTDLTNMSIINDNQITFFAYFPDKDIMLSSITYIDYFQEKEMDELKQYLLSWDGGNTADWKDVRLGDNIYFLHIYEHNGGYSGCYISCENVLHDIMPQDQECNIYILNMDGTVFYEGEGNREYADGFVFSRAVRMINKKICVEIPYDNFINSGSYIFLILFFAMTASLLLIGIALFYQNRAVFRPLLKLKGAMEEFSGGNTEVRLEERASNNEISVLYRTFNHMKDQILNLKIDIYTASLEKQIMYNQFLRVQIQPHFYTNILNLIYTLANARDFGTIQNLTRYMADYFRYLLSLKDDYVWLEEELQCVEYYAQVQRIRYKDRFLLQITCNTDAEREKIPPLVIQTFIENSIKYNVMVVQNLQIALTIEEEEEWLYIEIRDNGVGFAQEILDKLSRDEDIEREGKHIGITNVKNRLHALYENQAVLSVRNLETGCVVMIRIPRISEDERLDL